MPTEFKENKILKGPFSELKAQRLTLKSKRDIDTACNIFRDFEAVLAIQFNRYLSD